MANQSSVHKFLAVIVEFAKRKDGSTVLRCLRDDCSTTWQRNENQHARFFPVHDLTHYAVETELGYKHGFFGLIAGGWNIDDTTGKSPRGPLPAEAIEVEHLVSSFTAEWNSPAPWSRDDFNQQAREWAERRGSPAPRPLSDDELMRVRTRMNELCVRWRDLPAGETLTLPFPPR